MEETVSITLNGEPRSVPRGTTVAALLAQIPHPGVFAVEADAAIIPAEKYSSTVLHGGSVVEIVRFVGGG